MSTEYDRYSAELTSPPAGIVVPKGFRYIHFKAFLYREVGAEEYRERDALRMHPPDWPPESLEAVESGCRQIYQWRGISAGCPIEDIGIDGFYRLISLFHFRVVGQRLLDTDDGFNLDKMKIRHIVQGDELTLYNRVPEQTEIHF